MIRNIFFSTNHACAFNRLQYSAAFVATNEFHFAMSGTALFLNTFGWEMVGNFSMWTFSKLTTRSSLWNWYCWYQLVETLCSCISVSVLRRHLMVWATYAPRFLFVAIFYILNMTCQLMAVFLG
jgi:phosphatidylinositol glycan class O